jgi:hypothetical protein
MSLPWAARSLQIRYVVRNGRQSRGPAVAAALTQGFGVVGKCPFRDHLR